MDYEKKYNEALGKARAINSGKYVDIPVENTVLEYIFPELKESEDERIRKALIDALNKNLGNGIEKYGTTLNAALAWLEKQGEQKPFDYENANIQQKDFAPKQEWSEEDDRKFDECCGAVWAADYYTLDDKEEICDWLKSLKERLI